MYGATIGRLGILGIPATTNQACCVLPVSQVIDNAYLYYWFQAVRGDITSQPDVDAVVNAAGLHAQAVAAAIAAFASTGNAWEDPQGGVPPQLYGRPTFEAEAMDGTVTATEDNLIAIIGDGKEEKGMPPWKDELSRGELGAVVRYVMSLRGRDLPGKEPQGELVEE